MRNWKNEQKKLEKFLKQLHFLLSLKLMGLPYHFFIKMAI
ncbi:Uncharacterised protein [Salmonella enterica subsp. enterica serovar Typhimurium str. DT104]|nr:Uncharacterised protein [Salmonella enterica subsp. enterica serovar Typhimurium str. DT104]